MRHSILFLDLCSLRLQFLCSRCGSINSFSLTSASLHRPVLTCLLIPATVLCQGREWVALLAWASVIPCWNWEGSSPLRLEQPPQKGFLYATQLYKTSVNSFQLWWWSVPWVAAELVQDKGTACVGRAGDRTVQDWPSWEVRASPYCQPPLSAGMPLTACLGEEPDVLGKSFWVAQFASLVPWDSRQVHMLTSGKRWMEDRGA